MNRNLIKEQICDVCHKMWQLGWVAANDGNVSARLEDGTFLCTPTGMSKSFITPEKLIRINAKGEVLEGAEGLRPSSEIKMHLRCYEKRPDVWSVIHAHPPGATGFAVAHKAMDMYNMIEDVAVIGSVPLTPYGTPRPPRYPMPSNPIWKNTMSCCWRTTARWQWAAMSLPPSTAWKVWNCGQKLPSTR